MFAKNISKLILRDYLKHEYYRKIINYVKDKDVLDVGCVDGDIKVVNVKRLWNHWFIHLLAKRVTGIDIEKNSIRKMKSMGFNALYMSAEEIKFKNKFDVVFGGEVIEHLSNPGLFLLGAKKALKKDGVIVLSTPNTYAVNKIIRVIQLRTNEPPENLAHMMYFTPRNLQALCEKYVLNLIDIDYAHFPFINDTLLNKLNKIACALLGSIFKEQIITVISKGKGFKRIHID